MRHGFSSWRKAVVVAALAVGLAAPAAAQNLRITGAGASFPFPLYAAWFQEFSRVTGMRVDYQSTGSGAGVQSFIQRTVDFAGSDSAMTDEQIAEVDGGAVILPVTAGSIVLVYNLPGVTELKLPRDVYPAIFTGEVTRWSDERIAAANPGVTLPDTAITVVRRSDSSGTTFVFTKHLTAVNDTFAEQMGTGTTVQWPNLPNFVGAPRNDGVAATVMQTPGAIGYVEFGFAHLSGQPSALLENASGNFIAASAETGAAALASAKLDSDDLRIWVEDPQATDGYPISTFTWLLFFTNHSNPAVADGLRQLVTWALDEGQGMAEELGYIPLPENVISAVKAQVDRIQ